jgi:hypothetical protein
MRIHVTAAMAAVFLCAVIPASAQTLPPGKWMGYGAGEASCGKWLAHGNDVALHGIKLQWVLG